jgi:hypothetical protein
MRRFMRISTKCAATMVVHMGCIVEDQHRETIEPLPPEDKKDHKDESQLYHTDNNRKGCHGQEEHHKDNYHKKGKEKHQEEHNEAST